MLKRRMVSVLLVTKQIQRTEISTIMTIKSMTRLEVIIMKMSHYLAQ